MPKPVIRQANKYLQLLEDSSLARGNQDDLFPKAAPEPEQATDPLREEMLKVNPDELTARGARAALPAEETMKLEGLRVIDLSLFCRGRT